jgi:hypothetical protein
LAVRRSLGDMHVFPWWCGYLLANPQRRLGQNPRAILQPFVTSGMTVLEPGPGVGFFTLDPATGQRQPAVRS